MHSIQKGRVCHILIDGLLLFAGALLSYFTRVGFIISSDVPLKTYLIGAVIGSILGICFLAASGYYRLHQQSRAYRWISLFLASILSAGMVAISYYFFETTGFSRGLTFGNIGVSVLFLLFSDQFFLAWIQQKKQFAKDLRPTLVIGANALAAQVIAGVKNDPYADYSIVGCIDPYGTYKSVKGSQILGKMNSLESVCKAQNIDVILQCDAYEHAANVYGICDENNIEYWFLPAIRGVLETPQFRPLSEKIGLFLYEKPTNRAARFLNRQVFGR